MEDRDRRLQAGDLGLGAGLRPPAALGVARAIAELAAADDVAEIHVAEALRHRRKDGWDEPARVERFGLPASRLVDSRRRPP